MADRYKDEIKRKSIIVDDVKYKRMKVVLSALGMTYADFLDQAMDEFLEKMEKIILGQDKDAFMEMMVKNLDKMQKEIAAEIGNHPTFED